MNIKVMVSALLLVGMALSGCSGLPQPKPPGAGNPPVITASFAADKGMYGDIIKVYLAAEDPQGEMDRIAVQVSQVGYGVYPTSWTVVKPKYAKKFVGYIQWDTYSEDTPKMPEWTQISMNITVIDKGGNQSVPVVLPYQFVTGGFASPPLPAPFSQRRVIPRIGYIDIDLINPEAPMGPLD